MGDSTRRLRSDGGAHGVTRPTFKKKAAPFPEPPASFCSRKSESIFQTAHQFHIVVLATRRRFIVVTVLENNTQTQFFSERRLQTNLRIDDVIAKPAEFREKLQALPDARLVLELMLEALGNA